VDPEQDPGGQEMTHKSRQKLRNFMFCSAGCSLLKAEDSPASSPPAPRVEEVTKMIFEISLRILSRVADPDPNWIRRQRGQKVLWIRDILVRIRIRLTRWQQIFFFL
jgi:hypothetical protein